MGRFLFLGRCSALILFLWSIFCRFLLGCRFCRLDIFLDSCYLSLVAWNSQLFSFALFLSFSRISTISFFPCLKSSTVNFKERFPAEM